MTAALGAPAKLGDHVLRLTAGVGISIFPEDGIDADHLIDRAAAAMVHDALPGLGSFAFQDDVGERSRELQALQAAGRPQAHPAPATHETGGRHALLQEANTRLLLAALNAQELRDDAEQALRKQTSFLGVVAHELRSPLTPIRNAASILGRIPSGDPLLAKVQGIIERQVQNMTRLVEDLLDVSRVSSGKLRLEMSSVDMMALIDDAVQTCRPSMDTRLQVFEAQLPVAPVTVHGDPVRLAQVLGNLLDNASKYTPEGGKIRLYAAVEGNSMVLTVADNGIGITAQALATIFDPFVQEQHATLFNGTGLGIGLTVVRELVEGHGGKVIVTSDGKGRGSCFSVTLPLRRPSI
jgi:signal transduction histidine kinase